MFFMVINTSKEPLSSSNRPLWSRVTSAGIFCVPCTSGTFDRHYHDCNEYWLVFAGKAKIMSGERAYYVQHGDIVCTPAGDEHDVLEVYEDLEAFWFEDELPSNGRTGHLHRNKERAAGHAVPALALPRDFPTGDR
jgi:mannose-6-phosphate isomerase-like protein (cupin superfamily)